MSRLAPALITLLLAAPAWAHDRGYGYDHRPAYAYESGRVEVYNGSGGRVTVSLPGQPSAVLEPYRTAVLYAPAGETTLRATYAQFGADRVLKTERVFVQPGRTVRVGLAPERLARVRIVNNSPVSATLLVNGVSKAVLNPGEVRVATLPVGYADLQLLGAGRVLGQTHLELRAFAEPAWCVDVPAVGDLVVQNPLPIPVQLVVAGAAPLTVAPYGQTTLNSLPVGSTSVTVRRVSGQTIDTERVDVRLFSVSTMRIDPPHTGLFVVDSDLSFPTEVRIDGRVSTSLVPNGLRTMEADLGWHQVQVTDPYGRVVYAEWVEVDPYQVDKIEFGDDRGHERAYGDADRGQDRDHRDRDHDGDSVAENGEHCQMH
mgnify:FL=1|jgi:hypothetical protein